MKNGSGMSRSEAPDYERAIYQKQDMFKSDLSFRLKNVRKFCGSKPKIHFSSFTAYQEL